MSHNGVCVYVQDQQTLIELITLHTLGQTRWT